MIFVLLFWLLAFSIFFITGFLVIKIIVSFKVNINNSSSYTIDEYFFIGFLTLSAITGILSILIPIGTTLLIITSVVAGILYLVFFKEVKVLINEFVSNISLYNKGALILLICLILFLLSSVVHHISNPDTGLYHTQYIKWIRSYSVVPGLGNIHGRFAFNSMFFVISALFTFELNGTIFYPLNGLCFIILLAKLVSLLFRKRIRERSWKVTLYGILILISFLLLIRSTNSPSPDVICALLIIYSFIFLLNISEKGEISSVHLVLFNLLVFSCIAYKLSSLFIGLLIIPLLRKNLIKGLVISIVTGLIVIIPFLIRNYFLSGYLIYPFPSIDIFSVDWKIPLASVINEKSWIESWARIPGKPYAEVLNLGFSQWVRPWLDSINDFVKFMMAVNLFSFGLLVIMIIKKEYNLIIIMLILLVNYIFWFVNAPDPRFAYGILIFNFSFALAYFIGLFKFTLTKRFLSYTSYIFISLLIVLAFKFRSYPIHTIRHPELWLISTPEKIAETEAENENFAYRVSLSDSKCFNAEIPCTPYPLRNIVLRGKDLSTGFKVVNDSK
jgi:hypothetical protein